MQAVRGVVAVLLATVASAAALADEARKEQAVKLDVANFPVAVPQDPNVKIVAFSDSVRYRIVGNINRLTVITFGPDEKVIRLHFGDTFIAPNEPNIWETEKDEVLKESPLRNNLTLWGRKKGRTNIVVTTERPDGSERIYHFDGTVRDEPKCDQEADYCDDPAATHRLRFVYPEDEKRKREERLAEEARTRRDKAPAILQEASHRVAKARLAVDHYNGAPRNWCWDGQGDAAIGPNLNSVSDNRQEVSMDFGGRPVPAFMLVNPDGSDGETLQPIPRDNLIVLPVVAARIRLRLGDRMVLDLINCGSTEPLRHGTYTTRPDVYRTVKR